MAELADAGDSKSPGLKNRAGSTPALGTEEYMRDYTYIDAGTNSILVVCVGADNIIKADYLFKEAMGVWPWTFKHVYVDISHVEVYDDEYILEM